MHHYTPVFLPLPPIAKIDVGLQHCLALSRTGKLFGWGKGNRGQLTDTRNVGDKNDHPLRISMKTEIHDISLGFNHSAVLTVDGEVLVWGKGMSNIPKKTGSMAAEVYEDQFTPRKLEVPGDRKVFEICSSSFSLVARCYDGTVWAMGLGEYDRIALADFVPVFAYESDEQLLLEEDAILRKGHQRVTVAQSDGEVSQIIVHNREAYVKREFENLLMASNSVDASVGERVLDISIGWKHELMIVDKLQH